MSMDMTNPSMDISMDIHIHGKPGETPLYYGLGGISANSRTPLVFVPEGVKISAIITYHQLILDPVVKHMSKNIFNNGPFIFHSSKC